MSLKQIEISGLQRGLALTGLGVVFLILTGCTGTMVQGEREAREQVGAVGAAYRPDGQKPPLPTLTTNSPLADFLTYAMLNQPGVEAAYFDWLGSVERITIDRSLPDPQLAFQMDIREVVTSVMPGVMMSFPGMGKLKAAGAVAVAGSQAKYQQFKAASLESAYKVKRAYYRLYFLEEKIRVDRESLDLLRDLEELARTQNEIGKVTLQDVLRAQIGQDQLENQIANLEDSRGPLLAELKAALGLHPEEPAPPLPAHFESTSLDLGPDKLLQQALEENARLKAMESDVQAAEAAIRLAYKARMPDSSLGLMADVKMSPTMYRPTATVTLPIWRDKLAALVAEAQANKKAGEARLSDAQIALAVDIAERSFIYREATRNLQLLQNQLLPKQRQSLEVARSGYLAGRIDFFNVTETEQTLLQFGLDEVEARTQRELALAELSFIIQGMSPLSAGISMETGPVGTATPAAARSLQGGMTGMR